MVKILNIPILGWCNGVKSIFEEIDNITHSNPNTKLYCFKELVHNKASNNLLKQYKIKIINSFDQIKDKSNSIVLLQAHGSTKQLINSLKAKKINFKELTCRFVKSNQNKIISKLNDGYSCYFIGNKNHQETIAVLSIDKRIKFIDVDNYKKSKLSLNKKIFITNQTTLNTKIIADIKKFFDSKNITFIDGCCPEIKVRQKNVLDSLNKIDLLIVIGDTNSNNALELIALAKKSKIKNYLIQSKNQIKKINFKDIKKIGVCTKGINSQVSIWRNLSRIS